MSGEVWDEIYDRLAELIRGAPDDAGLRQHPPAGRAGGPPPGRAAGRGRGHRAPRQPLQGARLDAEERLKAGKLQALVATASLELGIDIGHVDLVCQLGTPRRISTFLQRVGRSGHTVRRHCRRAGSSRSPATSWWSAPRCSASVRAGQLDRHRSSGRSRSTCWPSRSSPRSRREDWAMDELFDAGAAGLSVPASGARPSSTRWSRCSPQGFATRRGRRGALIHHDAVNGRLRGRRGARLLAITSGGAIPDNADYRVVLEPEGTFIGTVNEDFAVESMAGDIFQLGNLSWRILRVQQGRRAGGGRPRPAAEHPVLAGRGAGAERRAVGGGVASFARRSSAAGRSERLGVRSARSSRLSGMPGSSRRRRRSSAGRLPRRGRAACSARCPTQDTIVAERFFDESGGMQLVIHAPFGSRVNRAWGLALRKRFCRQFNFELQAAATEDAILLSLGPQHSLPAGETSSDSCIPTRCATSWCRRCSTRRCSAPAGAGTRPIALAIPRSRGGRKVPPQLQRMEAEDLLAAAFPDAAACLENIPGDREVPDHPLVRQTIDDCLHEAMDVDGLIALLRRIRCGRDPLHRPRPAGAVAARARDPERPSLRLPRRRAAGGAPYPGGVHPPRLRALLRRRPRRARSRGDRAGARRGLARRPGRRRAARRAAHVAASSPRPRDPRRGETGRGPVVG